jgi:hypothetical protein
MALRRPERKEFPLAVRKLVDGSPAPLYGVRWMAAVDRLAPRDQAGYRHDADGPCRGTLGYGRRYVRVLVKEGRVEAPARYWVEMINNGNPKRQHGKRTI